MKTGTKRTCLAGRGRRRGFATAIALGLVGIFAVTLGVLTVSFAGDVRRSVRHAEDAQVRQLLIAGEVVASGALTGNANLKGNIELPPDLALAGVTVAYEQVSRDDSAVKMRVTVTTGTGRSVSQLLAYARAGDRWELRGAEL